MSANGNDPTKPADPLAPTEGPRTSGSTKSAGSAPLFRVRRLKNGLPLDPENPTFSTRMRAIEHAETLDLGAGQVVQVLEGDGVVWTSR